jgi:hypothetical protein
MAEGARGLSWIIPIGCSGFLFAAQEMVEQFSSCLNRRSPDSRAAVVRHCNTLTSDSPRDFYDPRGPQSLLHVPARNQDTYSNRCAVAAKPCPICGREEHHLCHGRLRPRRPCPVRHAKPVLLGGSTAVETGQSRLNCRTLLGVSKSPAIVRPRDLFDSIGPALFCPIFADIVAELEQCRGL